MRKRLYAFIKILKEANQKLFKVKLLEYSIYSLLPLLEFYIIKNLINASISHNTGDSMKYIFIQTILLIGLTGFKHMSSQIFKLSTFKFELDINKFMKRKYIIKIAKLKYRYIEDEEIYEKINRITKKSDQRMMRGFDAILKIGTIIAELLIAVIILSKYIKAYCLIFILLAMPIVLLSAYNGKLTYLNEKKLTKDTRKTDYLSEVLTNRVHSEERYIFNYFESFNKRWQEIYEDKTNTTYKLIAKLYLRMDLAAILMTILSAVIIYLFALETVKKAILIGELIAVTKLLYNLSNQMRWGMMDNVSRLVEIDEFCKDLAQFDKLEEEEKALEKRKLEEVDIKNITLKNLSFKYPNKEKQVIKNLNFKFEKGKDYAIVGQNGSGKSTLVKLLTGMYKNYEGSIYLNEVELRQKNINEIRNVYSVVYQDYSKYSLTVLENIFVGNISKEISKVEIDEAIKLIKLKDKINTLSNKLNTKLGKIHKSSTNLSGGQWQKLAMARTIYNPSRIRILDEPTAAIDPKAESELYEDFRKLGNNFTSIMISHRLASTKLADEIIVMDSGEIVEHGTHEELMKDKGLYHKMYLKQRSWYKDEK